MSYDNIYTRRVSYGENVRNSFKNAFSGIIIFLLSFVLLFWNEWHSMQQIKKMNFMSKHAIEVPVDLINNANDNKLIATSGVATTDATLNDGIVSVNNALALKRIVEMYQWKENKKTEDDAYGSTVEHYTYKKVWSEREIDSSNFYEYANHRNPSFGTLKSGRMNAVSGKLGAFEITKTQTKNIKNMQRLTNLPYNSQYKNYTDEYYRGENRDNPQIGDIRIYYKYVPSGVRISVIGQQQTDARIDVMPSKLGDIYLQYDGKMTKAQMLSKFKEGNNVFTNILRLVGFLMMFAGLSATAGPIVRILKILPFFGNLTEYLTKGAAFLLSLVLSLITIAVAWLFVRPLAAIPLFIIAFVACAFFENKNMNNKLKE